MFSSSDLLIFLNKIINHLPTFQEYAMTFKVQHDIFIKDALFLYVAPKCSMKMSFYCFMV